MFPQQYDCFNRSGNPRSEERSALRNLLDKLVLVRVPVSAVSRDRPIPVQAFARTELFHQMHVHRYFVARLELTDRTGFACPALPQMRCKEVKET